MLLLSVYRSIDEIDSCQWNHLAGENAFATHAWLRTIEASCRARLDPLYFALTDEQRLVAAAVCYVCPVTRDIETLDDLIFGRLSSSAHALGLTFLPAVLCGPLLGYGWHIGVDAGLDHNECAVARRAVLDGIAGQADARGLPLVFVHVTDEEQELRTLLDEERFLRCRNIPVAVLDIKWQTFEEYLAERPSKRRREFLRQIKRYRDAGNDVGRLESLGAEEPRLLELLDRNGLKHNRRPFPCGDGFFTTLTRSAGRQARIFVSRKAGRITAASVMLVQNCTAFPIAVGVDDVAAGNDYSYFHVAYNTLISHAIETGIRRMYYGRGLSDVKVRRGCRLTDSWIYLRSKTAPRVLTRGWFMAASFWNRHQLSSEARRSLVG